MGRHAVFRNYLLPISVVITLIGLVPTVLAFLVADYDAAVPAPGWYVQVIPSKEWNLWVRIMAPLVLLTGLWYAGEQVLLRRKFHRLVDTHKRSDLAKNMGDIEGLLGRLPKTFEAKVQAKESSFKSRR